MLKYLAELALEAAEIGKERFRPTRHTSQEIERKVLIRPSRNQTHNVECNFCSGFILSIWWTVFSGCFGLISRGDACWNTLATPSPGLPKPHRQLESVNTPSNT